MSIKTKKNREEIDIEENKSNQEITNKLGEKQIKSKEQSTQRMGKIIQNSPRYRK